jgi:hypothetical protein
VHPITNTEPEGDEQMSKATEGWILYALPTGFDDDYSIDAYVWAAPSEDLNGMAVEFLKATGAPYVAAPPPVGEDEVAVALTRISEEALAPATDWYSEERNWRDKMVEAGYAKMPGDADSAIFVAWLCQTYPDRFRSQEVREWRLGSG